jgi:hypothetical protein
MFQTKVVEKIKIQILCSVTFFFEDRTVYEIMWVNVVEPDRRQMTTWRMRFACCVHTHNNNILYSLIDINHLNRTYNLSFVLLSRISSGLHTEWRYCRFNQTYTQTRHFVALIL